MGFLAFGINHKSASVDLRGQVAYAPDSVARALQHLLSNTAASEAALLSTCNRTEIYLHGELDDGEIINWLASDRNIEPDELRQCYYCHRDDAAIRHLMRVASGLDSLVLGEPQILGQIKSAYAVGREADSISTFLNQAFQQAFYAAKRVRSETAIGQNPVSVAYAGVSLAQQIFSELHNAHALLIGAGETIELVARHLADKNIGKITVANRTLSRAHDLAQNFNAEAILLSEIPEHLHKADIVISSTASQLPILGKGAVESALKKRKRKPMFMLDIAVPRDIEAEVEKLSDVYLYTVDDLEEVIQDNIRARETAADLAHDIIEDEVESWHRQQRALTVVDTIRAFRGTVEAIRDQEVEKALQALQRGQDAEQVIQSLARSLTNKLMHKPTTKLRQAGEQGHDHTIHATHELFDLEKKP